MESGPHQHAWKLAALVGAGAIGAYFAVRGAGGKDAAYSVIGLASVTAVLVGARWHRADRRGWVAIAAGNLCFVAGDGVYDVYQYVLHRTPPSPSAADAFYLAGYPALILGVVLLTRSSGQGRGSVESYADAAIVTCGALAVTWHFLMASYAHDPTISGVEKLISLAYPGMDLGVVFIVVRSLVFGRARDPVLRLLALAMGAMILADLAYDLLTIHGTYTVGSPLDAGWLVNYVLVGVAALHPHRVAPPEVAGAVGPGAAVGGDGAVGGVRPLPLVALAGLLPPSILLVASLLGGRDDVTALAAVSVVLFALVVVRMRWMVLRLTTQSRTLGEALAERNSLESELRHLAFHDSLTGLANRTLFHDRVDRALAAGAHTGVAVCFCDLDGFKTVNDSLGHGAGDAMLIAVGKRLATVVRPGDTVARLGGDEFAVLLENVHDVEVAASVAERIVSVLHEPVTVAGRQVRASVSVGLAVAALGATTERLLSEADSAMYEAKATGKNRYNLFESTLAERISERLELGNALGGALERGELFLRYQPQHSLDDGRLEGFEALLRWQHPTLGLVHPERFIALAEERGEVVAIGRWVLETACEQATAWQRCGVGLTVSVNVSGRQLQDRHLVDDVLTAAALAGLDPALLVVEVTETTLVDSAGSLRALADLRAAGVRVSIDDFGTGYSSLSHLQRLPVDELKIDKSFIAPLSDRTGEAGAFVQTIIRLARDLGLRTVAEGVEDDAQRLLLRRLGCDRAQGYLLGRPMDAHAAHALAAAHARRTDRVER